MPWYARGGSDCAGVTFEAEDRRDMVVVAVVGGESLFTAIASCEP